MSTEETGNLSLAIVAQTADAIIFADRQGVIRLWNPAAEAVFGFSADEVIGQSLDLIIPERLRPAHWKAFHQAIEAGRTRLGRRALLTRSVHKSGGKLYVDVAQPPTQPRSGVQAITCAMRKSAHNSNRIGLTWFVRIPSIGQSRVV